MASIRRRGESLGRQDHGLDIMAGSEGPQDATVVVNSAPTGVVVPVEDLPADLLTAPEGMEDDLAHALAARPARRRLPGASAFLGAAVLIAGGFLGGVLTQKHEGGSTAGGGGGNAATLAALRGTRTGGTGTAVTGAGGTGAATGGSGTTIGTVKLVDGSKIYLTATDGSTVVVTTGKSTTIRVTKNGTAGDLAPGTTVVVQGKADASGVVQATTVTQGGGAGGFGAGGFGGGAGRTRTGGTGGTGTGGTAGAGGNG